MYNTHASWIFQTIFEINSNNKTSASEVMRTKRSRDSRLVDRFQKTREDMKAESQQNRPVIQSTATTQQYQGEEEDGDDDDDLQVNLKVRSLSMKVCFILECHIY